MNKNRKFEAKEEVIYMRENDKQKLDYKSKASFEKYMNMAFFKIFSDYFNIIKQNPEEAKKHKISEITFFRYKEFLDSIQLSNYAGETNVRFRLNGEVFNFCFDKYRQNDEYFYTLIITSEEKLLTRGPDVFKIIFENAVSISNLRGEYLEMPRNIFAWNINELEKRGFNDIFLPTNLMDDLSLYVKVSLKKKRLMRYLMVGNPGTGKTESTLVLANELKKQGVTILKTPVDDFLKEKIQLAEALAPSILIFDDLDLSIGSRTSGGYSPKELQMFLDAMDGTDKISKNVGIISTTNSSKLLDLAAQRPGRFEKILTFDRLTKKNIGDIILKSLKYNSKNADKKLFFNKEVVNKFYEAKVTGAYIYNSINILNLKSEMLDEETNLEWILKELNQELDNTKNLANKDHLKEGLTPSSKSLGFGATSSDSGSDDEEPDYDIDEPCTEVEAQRSIRKDSSQGRD